MLTIKTLRNLAIAATALAPSAAVVAQTPQSMAPADRDLVLRDMEKYITQNAYVPGVDFTKWPALVAKHKGEIDKADDQIKFTKVMNEALEEFGFSHIVLFSPQLAEARTNRKMVGLGIRIQPEEKGLRIVMIFPGTPAFEAGMHEGDLIIERDGKPVKTTNDLAGEEGSKVKVTVDRSGSRKDFDITRRAFSTDVPETIKWIDKETAMVTVPTFDLGYKKSRVTDIMNEAMTAKNLILDLRSNGGGQVINLLHLSSFFMETNVPLGTFVNRSMANAFAKETGKPGTDALEVAKWSKSKLYPSFARSEHFEGKIVVLVNGGTGSASEMMAAALKEQKGAKIVGSKSAGAVLASLMTPIAQRFVLQYPVMDYVTVKGHRLEGNGLVPDVSAPAAQFGKEDEAVKLSLKVFTSTD
ncbi:MAG: PDZ domain-containing protein [Armatimonadetes bacterium]|nr:PDZ domain-containing protein [Armatimonadota bacterium]